MKKLIKWIGIWLLAMFGLIVLISIVDNDKDTSESSELTEQVTEEPKELTIEEKIHNQIENELGNRSYRSHSNSYIDKVKEVKITNNFLFIKLSANENAFGRSMEKFAIKSNIIKIMQTIEIPDDVEMVAFEFYYPTRDENYNYKETLVMSGWIEKEKFDINWDNVYDTDLPNIMIDVYWRPGF